MSRMKEARVQDGNKLTITYEPYSFDEQLELLRTDPDIDTYYEVREKFKTMPEAERVRLHVATVLTRAAVRLWKGTPGDEYIIPVPGGRFANTVYATKDQAYDWALHGHIQQADPDRWGVDPRVFIEPEPPTDWLPPLPISTLV